MSSKSCGIRRRSTTPNQRRTLAVWELKWLGSPVTWPSNIASPRLISGASGTASALMCVATPARLTASLGSRVNTQYVDNIRFYIKKYLTKLSSKLFSYVSPALSDVCCTILFLNSHIASINTIIRSFDTFIYCLLRE